MYPVDVTIQGMALNDFGFVAYNNIEGLSLNTFGFLFPCEGIWATATDPVTTAWTNVLVPGSVEECVD